MLSGAGLRDQAGLSHLLGKERLPQNVVDLVGSCKVQVLTLEIDLRPAQVLCHFPSVIQAAWPVCILVEKNLQFTVERRVIFIMPVRLVQFYDCIHQSLRYVLSPEASESSSGICLCCHPHPP